MLPETVFTKMNALGLTSEQSIGVSQLLFQSVETMTEKMERAIEKMMDRMETSISKMNENFGQQILQAVQETEEKIFARMAAEAAEQEEKKRLRREAIAARKAAKDEKEGEVAVAAGTFQADGTNATATVAAGSSNQGGGEERKAGGVSQTEGKESGDAENLSPPEAGVEQAQQPLMSREETVAMLNKRYELKAKENGFRFCHDDPEYAERHGFIAKIGIDAFDQAISDVLDEVRDEYFSPELNPDGKLFGEGDPDDIILDEAKRRLEPVVKRAEETAALEWERLHGRAIEFIAS